MNNILAWVKTNWVIVLLSAVVLAVLPAGLLVSGSMDRGVREEMSKKVTEDWNEVSKDKVSYSIPSPMDPSKKLLEHSDAPNKTLIEWFDARREEIKTQADAVWAKALEFNKDDHKVLIDGIFPAPAELDKTIKPIEFTKVLIDTIPARLLERIGAGGPADPDRLAARVREQWERRVSQEQAQGEGELNPQVRDRILEELVQMRIAEYRRRAGDIRVYATPASLVSLPAAVPTPPPDLKRCWDYQEAIWVYEDLMRAIALVNGGDATGVPNSVVKRIHAISIEPGPAPAPASEGGGGKADGLTGPLSPDKSISLTGRIGGGPNQLYDIRYAKLDLVVSSQRLPQFVDALAQTNFFTVLDCDLTGSLPGNQVFDLNKDLEEGYYYGDEHVVRATLLVEAILFRDWTRDAMPAEVKSDRGAADAPKAAEEPAAPPPPQRPAARPNSSAPAAGGGRRRHGDEDLPG